jgi:hypothetical protein
MTDKKRLTGVRELIQIANRARGLARETHRERDPSRIAGRLLRTPHDSEALAAAYVYQATTGSNLSVSHPQHFFEPEWASSLGQTASRCIAMGNSGKPRRGW